MSLDKHIIAPEHTAVRVALWRALHVQIDPKPHILTDEVGEKLVAEENWKSRQDMNPDFSKGMRASIVGRARFIEDIVEEEAKKGVTQYVILGAGLDTFAQRRADLAGKLHIFEVDQPGPQAWKKKRLTEIGYSIPDSLHFVPVDFESGQSWWEQLLTSSFDLTKPAVVVSTGVSMYLTKEANRSTLEQLAKLVSGSTFAMTFMLALDLLSPEERGVMEFVMKKTQDAGTPFLSLFSPPEILSLAKEAGFTKSEYVSGEDIYQRYFASRSDGLRAGNAEAFLVAGI
ncbi:MAG: class I SAM-dependent methyltransferase [Leptospiraceae bacterium]|nr:class I SAM-dependent methyltransferase [Leptospiraceae bacterium]